MGEIEPKIKPEVLRGEVIGFLDSTLYEVCVGSRNKTTYKLFMEMKKTEEEEREVRERFSGYLQKLEEHEKFMREDHDVIEYIASLAIRCRVKTVSPEKYKLVLHILRILEGTKIYSPGGFESTQDLELIVKRASRLHARRMGENPRKYYKLVSEAKEEVPKHIPVY